MADFDPQALLTKPMDDIKPPAKLPLGSYVAQATDYEFDKTKPKDSSKQPTNVVKVKIVLIEAFPDVNQEELAAVLEGGKALTEIEVRPLDYFLTEAAAFRLKELIEEHARIGADEASNLSEGLEVLKSGRQFGVLVEAQPNTKNPENPYHNITKTFALPES